MSYNEPTRIRLHTHNPVPVVAKAEPQALPLFRIRRVERRDLPDLVGIDAKASSSPWGLEEFWRQSRDNGMGNHFGVLEDDRGRVRGCMAGYYMREILHISKIITLPDDVAAFNWLVADLVNSQHIELYHAVVVTVNEFDVELQKRLRDCLFRHFHTSRKADSPDYYQFIFRLEPIANRLAKPLPV